MVCAVFLDAISMHESLGCWDEPWGHSYALFFGKSQYTAGSFHSSVLTWIFVAFEGTCCSFKILVVSDSSFFFRLSRTHADGKRNFIHLQSLREKMAVAYLWLITVSTTVPDCNRIWNRDWPIQVSMTPRDFLTRSTSCIATSNRSAPRCRRVYHICTSYTPSGSSVTSPTLAWLWGAHTRASLRGEKRCVPLYFSRN